MLFMLQQQYFGNNTYFWSGRFVGKKGGGSLYWRWKDGSGYSYIKWEEGKTQFFFFFFFYLSFHTACFHLLLLWHKSIILVDNVTCYTCIVYKGCTVRIILLLYFSGVNKTARTDMALVVSSSDGYSKPTNVTETYASICKVGKFIYHSIVLL